MFIPHDPFLLLKKTVNVLVVDDDPGILDILEMHLSFFQIYSISRAASTAKAMMKIEESGSRFHVCVLDRGLYDVDGNEFYLMDKYRQKIPFIVITGRKDSEKAFECGEHGGKKVLSKGGPDF